MYHNGCKYARSTNPNKFKLSKTKDPVAEKTVENMFQTIATFTGRIYKKLAPDSHSNQVNFYLNPVDDICSAIRVEGGSLGQNT